MTPAHGAPRGNRFHFKSGRFAQFHQRVNASIYAQLITHLKAKGITMGDWLELMICRELGITLRKDRPE